MSEMVDRGADAMRTKRRELINQPLDRIWPDLMRAAIEAMRQPLIEMIDAAQIAGSLNDEDIDEICWKAMIDEALKVRS